METIPAIVCAGWPERGTARREAADPLTGILAGLRAEQTRRASRAYSCS